MHFFRTGLFAVTITLFCALLTPLHAGLGLTETLVSDTPPPGGAFPLSTSERTAPLWHDATAYPGVVRAIGDLQADIERVTSRKPSVTTARPGASATVIIGTVGRSALIDGLASAGKLDVSDLVGKWESFVITTVEQPFPGVERALVIAGSDKRGTIYGIYELSEQLGVSPWYWWADAPVKHRTDAFVAPGRFASGEPAVRYRGIFINDEAPALSSWAHRNHRGFTAPFYGRVFELLLRLRANYLWPAMWGNAFNEDDPASPALADDYGIVMGTSHHEPMLRAQQEWKKHGSGPWDYAKNGEVLRQFWTEGIRRNRAFESMVTIGMRGDGDEPMSEEANVDLLQKIVADQRTILERELGKPAAAIPQLWALYKEVQGYYEHGMRVPDDVTLLWCDDNWGNIRRLPTSAERGRAGGAGVYYHFDYVGGPRNYKWLNTIPLPKIQEQMNLAWRHDANRIWIVNVGDLKPMEVPMEFFLRMAWDPSRWPAERLGDYLRLWATREFGQPNAAEAASLVATYTKFNGRRKPEMLAPDTFSLVHHREAERVVTEWKELAARAERLHAALPDSARDAFYQLVLHPIKACAIVNELYVTAGLNRLHATQGRASANDLARRARELFEADAALTTFWNTGFANGKWRGLMDQTHIGYTSWQQPDKNILPEVSELVIPDLAELGAAVEGDEKARTFSALAAPAGTEARLPLLSSEGGATTRWIEVFRRGTQAAGFKIEANQPWVTLSPAAGAPGEDVRVEVGIDWTKAPAGNGEVVLTLRSADGANALRVLLPYDKAAPASADVPRGFLDVGGYVAIEASHFDRAVESRDVTWKVLPDFGRTLAAVTPFPVTAASRELGPKSPRLDYTVYLTRAGEVTVRLVAAPTLGYVPGRGLRCAVSFDDAPPQTVDFLANFTNQDWEKSVGTGVHVTTARLSVAKPGLHVLKFWMIDPAVVLQRIEIDAGGLKPTYLGPPESPRGRR